MKRLSGVAQQQGGLPSSFCGPLEQNPKVGSLGRFDIQALAVSGQIPPQTLAALHAELLNRPTGNLVLPAMDQPALLQASVPVSSKCISLDQNVAYGQPLMKCPPIISKHFSQNVASAENVHSGIGSWSTKNIINVVNCSNLNGAGAQNGSMIMGIVQSQQQPQIHQQEQQHHKQSILPDPGRTISVQPSCLVVPSHSSANFQVGNSLTSVNQNSSFSGCSTVDYNILSPQSNCSSFGAGKILDVERKPTCMLSGLSGSGSISPSSIAADNALGLPVQTTASTFGPVRPLPGIITNMSVLHSSYDSTSAEVLDHGPPKSAAFYSSGATLPSRFAVDEPELSMTYQGKISGENNSGSKVKQEPNMNFADNAKVGVPILQRMAPNDLMSVFSE